MEDRRDSVARMARRLGALVAWLVAGQAHAVCCPAGCVQNGGACVRTGPTPSACATVLCNPGPSSGSSGQPGSGGGGGGVIVFPHAPTKTRLCTLSPNQIVPGSWVQSCRQANHQCDADRDEIKAICRDRQGRERKTSLQEASRCGNLENINGRLTCKKWHRRMS